MIETKESVIKVLLVGLDTGQDTNFENSFEELKGLCKACNRVVCGEIIQKASNINNTWYIGSGKVYEVKELAQKNDASEIIFDSSLTPHQHKNLLDVLKLPVFDRTTLILDIFAIRARTKEAKLQVEMARLEYMLPRLNGMNTAKNRQGGTSGSMSNKGSGEKKLELDRREIEKKINDLKEELAQISKIRENQRKKRDKSMIPKVSLVGYTNAGKSTIMNKIVENSSNHEEKLVFEKDMLFSTLDTNVRRIDLTDGFSFLLADTVGFINKLPTGLIKAFRSTLMEVKYSDLLIIVMDISDEDFRNQLRITEETLKEIDAINIPKIMVYNKVDKCSFIKFDELPKINDKAIYISASQNLGIWELLNLIENELCKNETERQFIFEYKDAKIYSELLKKSRVKEIEYLPQEVKITLICNDMIAGKYKNFLV